jgi:hypothetical protein
MVVGFTTTCAIQRRNLVAQTTILVEKIEPWVGWMVYGV